MKNFILFVLFSITLSGFSQNNYSFKNGGSIVNNGQKISPSEVRNLFKSNPKALSIYNTGRTKKTAGNLFLYGGLGIMT